MKGPEPTVSLICLKGSVSATRLGMMNGARPLCLASVSRSAPYFSFRTIWNVRSSTTRYSAMNSVSFCPMASRAAQRLSEAMQSSAATGFPSWKFSPSRSLMVAVRPSSLMTSDSAICGCGCSFASSANSVS
ncbi:hypothetical protein ES703_125219 [subsurface metagenome]